MTVVNTLADAQPDEPSVMGADTSHETLRAVLSQRPPGKVLDAACGEGVLAKFLNGRGWEVHCADIFPELFKLDGIPITKANLNRPLPFEDASFDAVVCANAMHRLFNPAGAVLEFFRILRPGGRLYLNVNNYASIETRLRFLFYGSLDHRGAYEEGVKPLDDPEGDVRHRIMYPQLDQYLEAAGFETVQVRSAPPRLRHRWLAPAAGIVWLLGRVVPARKRAANRLQVTNARPILFGGYYYLVEAVRP
jgi:SAM-dependent methyltransferase